MNALAARMPGLDLLRIAAGLALIVCHAGFWLAPFRFPDTLWMFLGHAGVELFLVSSGFLLALPALSAARPLSIPLSWARGAFRLMPLYWLLLAINWALLPVDVPRPEWVSYLTLTQNLAWPHPDFFGEAWIVAAAAMILLLVPVICHVLHGRPFRFGMIGLLGLLIAAQALRGVLVGYADPTFDAGVRKILVARLDLPLYGVLLAWLWTHQHTKLMRWRGRLAVFSLIGLSATALIHLCVPLDHSVPARIFLLSLCDIAWVCLLPWACAVNVRRSAARMAQLLATSAYAGLLTHVTVLRIGAAAGMTMAAERHLQGLLMLSVFVLIATVVAVLVYWGLDRPLLALRERWLPRPEKHPTPVPER